MPRNYMVCRVLPGKSQSPFLKKGALDPLKKGRVDSGLRMPEKLDLCHFRGSDERLPKREDPNFPLFESFLGFQGVFFSKKTPWH